MGIFSLTSIYFIGKHELFLTNCGFIYFCLYMYQFLSRERVSDCLMPTQQFFSYTMARTRSALY